MQINLLSTFLVIISITYIGIWMVVLGLFNDLASKFGIFFFLPVLFLMIPKSLKFYQSIIVLFITCLLFSSHNSLPTELCIFLLFLFYFIFKQNFILDQKNKETKMKIIAISLNSILMLVIFIFALFEISNIQPWSFYKLLLDTLASSLLLIILFKPYRFFLNQLLSRFLKLGEKIKVEG